MSEEPIMPPIMSSRVRSRTVRIALLSCLAIAAAVSYAGRDGERVVPREPSAAPGVEASAVGQHMARAATHGRVAPTLTVTQTARGTLLGHVGPGGWAVRVTAIARADGRTHRTFTSADGSYALADLVPGAYDVYAAHLGEPREAASALTAEIVADQATTLDLELPAAPAARELPASTAVVTGRVVDAAGRPLAGVRIVAVPGAEGRYRDEEVAARSDRDGRFELAGAPAGTMRMLVMPGADHGGRVLEVELATGAAIDVGALSL